MKKINNKINKIDIRVNDDTISKFNTLIQYYNISKTKLVEKMIDYMYGRDIMGNDFSTDVKKDCMTHMCNIVTNANCIEDDEVRKNILAEAGTVCQILR